jgi:hypothetical protein
MLLIRYQGVPSTALVHLLLISTVDSFIIVRERCQCLLILLSNKVHRNSTILQFLITSQLICCFLLYYNFADLNCVQVLAPSDFAAEIGINFGPAEQSGWGLSAGRWQEFRTG